MRVLYFTRGYTPHDHRFLASLAESGQEVYFLRLEQSGRQLEDRPLPAAVRQVHWQGGNRPFSKRRLPALAAELKTILREVKPDVLHAGPIQTVAFVAALTGFHPLVSMSWGSDLLKDADSSPLNRWITRYTLGHSNVLVGDCQAVRDKAAAFGFPDTCIFTFPWGIDLQRFSPLKTSAGAEEDGGSTSVPAVDLAPGANLGSAQEFRARLGWQADAEAADAETAGDAPFVVLSLRSWEPVYGVDVMLRGFALAARQDAAAEPAVAEAAGLRLLLLGGGSQAGLVHQIIQENGLQNQVYLGGQVKQADLPTLYRAADLYVSASHSDGSSVSLMEALGCGLPVLVTDIPSNREWVTDGVEGWLFPDNDSQAVAEGILRARSLARQQPRQLPGQMSQIRQAARERAEQRADWKKNFLVLLRAYDQAVRDCSPRGAR